MGGFQMTLNKLSNCESKTFAKFSFSKASFLLGFLPLLIVLHVNAISWINPDTVGALHLARSEVLSPHTVAVYCQILWSLVVWYSWQKLNIYNIYDRMKDLRTSLWEFCLTYN